jgi:hypothetical protein
MSEDQLKDCTRTTPTSPQTWLVKHDACLAQCGRGTLAVKGDQHSSASTPPCCIEYGIAAEPMIHIHNHKSSMDHTRRHYEPRMFEAGREDRGCGARDQRADGRGRRRQHAAVVVTGRNYERPKLSSRILDVL